MSSSFAFLFVSGFPEGSLLRSSQITLLLAAGLRFHLFYHLPSALSHPAPHFLCAFLTSDVFFFFLIGLFRSSSFVGSFAEIGSGGRNLKHRRSYRALCCAALPSSEGGRGERTSCSCCPHWYSQSLQGEQSEVPLLMFDQGLPLAL